MHLRLVFRKTIFKGGYMKAHFGGSHMKPGQSLLYSITLLYDEEGEVKHINGPTHPHPGVQTLACYQRSNIR